MNLNPFVRFKFHIICVARVFMVVLLACLALPLYSQSSDASSNDPVLIIVGPGINDAIGVNDALNGPNTKAGQLLYHTLQTFGTGANGFKPTSVRFEGDLAYFRVTAPKMDADNPGRIVGYERKEIGYPADADNRELMSTAARTVASQVAGESRRAILTLDMDLDARRIPVVGERVIPVVKGVASIAGAAADAIGNMIPGHDAAYRLSLASTDTSYTPPEDWQKRVDEARTVWNTETERAAVFIEQAAREFKRKWGQNAKVIVVGHSAFTNAIDLAPLWSEKGKNGMRLIDMRVMSSPMMHVMNEPDPDHTLFVTHDTDFPSANMGNPMSTRSGGDMQREGTVITLHGTSASSWWEDPAVAAGHFVRERTLPPFGAGERLAEELVTNIQSHRATQELSRTFDMDVCVYGQCVQHRGTPAQVINRQADAIFKGRPVAQALTQALHQEAPKETPVGGISLSKPAEMPFPANAVRNLTVSDDDPPRLAFTMRDGAMALLPEAELGIAAAAFTCAYGENRGPELSLEGGNFDGREVQSVRYPCASAARTPLANAMLFADRVLGSIAWGQNADYRAPSIPNYHPYAEIALDDPRIDDGTLAGRVWLVPALVRLGWGEDNVLRLAEARMAVRFEFWDPQRSEAYMNGAKIGMRTPAGEFLSSQLTHAYADTLEQDYSVLRDLREPVALTAALLWARLNRIPVDARADGEMKRLLDEAHARYTPPPPIEEVVRGESLFHIFPAAELREVDATSLARPAAIFNRYGPSRFLWEDGRESRIEYTDGRIERLVGRDGRAARVLYNERGIPLGMIGEDGKGIAAIPEQGFSIIAIGAEIDPATMTVMVPRHAPMFVEGDVSGLFAKLVTRWVVAQRSNDTGNSWLMLDMPGREVAPTTQWISWIIVLGILCGAVLLFRRRLSIADFFFKRRIRELIRRSRDDTRMDQYNSIVELGRLPPIDESVASLIRQTQEGNSAAAVSAIRALGMMNDRRATEHLVRLIQKNEGRIEFEIEKALGQPHHSSAIPELAKMVSVLCRDHDEVLPVIRMLDLMRSIDPLASQPYIEALAPLVLACSLRELSSESNLYGCPGESVLALCQQTEGCAALQTLQDALVQHHKKIIMTSGRYESISNSLSWLRASTRPAAAATVMEFMRTPSRQVTKLVSRVVSDDDDPAVQYVWQDIFSDTFELGQPRSLEELAERDATGPEATDHARQTYLAMKAERERREKVYPDLLNLGDKQDLVDYAQACLKDAVYDVYSFPPAESHEPSKPKLNHLALFLQRASDNTKAVELLKLILDADRTRLWASTREAFALRQTMPAWPPEINWKPLALELLERTGDPSLDEFLVSQIETYGGASEPSLLWRTLERRNPSQLLDLAARLLLHRTAYTIPSNDRRWIEAPTRELLSETLSCDKNLNFALDVVLANTPTALHIAREMHGRRKRRNRIPAYLIMCFLTGPAVEAELSAWVAAETDKHILDNVALKKGTEFVKQCKAEKRGQ